MRPFDSLISNYHSHRKRRRSLRACFLRTMKSTKRLLFIIIFLITRDSCRGIRVFFSTMGTLRGHALRTGMLN
jgi:hypothetical protein